MATPRYLTAQKISLLVLTRLYCGSALPSSATIPVLSFILASSIPATTSSARGQPLFTSAQQDASFPIDRFEDVLQDHASSMPGRTLLDLFLKHMWDVNSFDALHTLFDGLKDLIDAPPLDTHDGEAPDRIYLTKTSPLGAFVRRAHLEFTRLQFDDSMKLWSSFIKYRAPTAQWTKRLANLASGGVDTIVMEMGLSSGDDVYEVVYGHLDGEEADKEESSLDDLDRILEFQLERLQKFGDRVPEAMKAQLRTMVNSSGLAHRQAHLVQFFDAWKAGDYTAAFDNLHRYYDYAMQVRDRIHYQYALLHMAILQADFGCFGEAIAAINETISTARENQDMTCLSFSLNWLSHMGKAYPKQMKGAGYVNMLGNERDALMYLKAKAKENKMYNLLSATMLNEAKSYLAEGESVPRALEQIYQASHLIIREGISSFGSQMLLTSTLYSRIGIPHMSLVHCELLLDCYENTCPVDERIRAMGRRVFIISQGGRYDEAISTLEAIDASLHKSLKFHQYLCFCIGLIKMKRAIRRSDWKACDHLLETLKPPSDPDSDPLDPELSFLRHDIYIDYLISRGCYSEAYSAISALAASLKADHADHYQRVAVLLMKADLFRRAGKPEMGFSIALRAASVSYRGRLMPSLWNSVSLIGNILNSLGEYDSARRLVEGVLPQALEGADHLIVGTLYSHLADSHMGLANPESGPDAENAARAASSPPSARSGTGSAAKTELYVDRAREYYKKCEYKDGECDQLMKKAIMAKLRGDEKLAEEWAQNHNRMWAEGRLEDEALYVE